MGMKFFPLCLVITFCAYVSQTDAALSAMSIDFGSQFIKIGLVKPGVPMEIVLNKESRRKSPNLVSIKNKERLFAEAAAAMAVKYPQSSYQYLLHLLAQTEGSPAVKDYKANFPFTSFTFDEVRKTIVFPSDSESYNVETLLAMILWNCNQDAQAYAGQTVKDVVITIPAFFNQAERRAMTVAAKIAGLNLLQLLSDGSAAALNYGVFRRREITSIPQNLLIYDMGASKTTATIVEYVLVEDPQLRENNPVVRTIGVGFDRTLGGLQMTKRLHQYLEKKFRASHKTSTDISTNARSIAKLFKEAERLKQVLSANTDHFAQVESAHEDQDFKTKVTRSEFEDLIMELDERYITPIEDALKMANISKSELQQIVLMGAGTRVPRVQDVLQTYFDGKELGRFLNTDEAIALGALYQAAHLSKAFRVLPFGVSEIILYPIDVSFLSRNETTGVERTISRTIFGAKTWYPTPKKTISMTSYTDDFSVHLKYSGIDQILTSEQLKRFGETKLATVTISGLTDSLANYSTEHGMMFKGVKVQFSIDLSGIVGVTKAQGIIELPPEPELKSDEKEQNTTDDIAVDNAQNVTAEAEKIAVLKNLTVEEKSKRVLTNLTVSLENTDLASLSEESIQASMAILDEFKKIEKEKHEREAAMNELETLIYDLTVKTEEGEEFAEHCTADELSEIKSTVAVLRTWMEDEADINTSSSEFVEKRKILDALIDKPKYRKMQYLKLPGAFAQLNILVENATSFLAQAENFTTGDEPIFTENELEVLRGLINTSTEYHKTNVDLLAQKQKNEDPNVDDKVVKNKAIELQREVAYLANKWKLYIQRKELEIRQKAKEEAEKKATEEKLKAAHSEEKAEDETVMPSATPEPVSDKENMFNTEEVKKHDAGEF